MDRLTSHVRHLRERGGLAPAELARRVGVSRQALHAIETHGAVPSTLVALQLARALGCTVEKLFSLGGPGVQAVLIGQAALPVRVQLAQVGERRLAFALGGESGLGQAADGVATAHGQGEAVSVELFADLHTDRAAQSAVLVGCDPSLGLVASRLERAQPPLRLLWHPMSSTAALQSLARGEAHAAGIHLYEAASGVSNVAAVARELPQQTVQLYTLWSWEQGLMVAGGNPRGLHTPTDLLRPGVRLLGREVGSGSRALLDGWLAGAGAVPFQPSFVGEASSHLEAAARVAAGQADAAPGPRAAAQAHGLDFVPLQRERFDLAVPLPHTGHPAIAALLALVRQPAFRAELSALGGYHPGHAGELWRTISPTLPPTPRPALEAS